MTDTMFDNSFMVPVTLEDKTHDISFDVYDPVKDDVQRRQMSDFHGEWTIVFFYPADFTFVCPTELKDLNKTLADLKAAGANVLVASVDSVFSHKRRVETEKLLEGFEIPMISDRKGELSEMFGILNHETGNSERATFILSPEGVVKSVEIVTEPIGRSSNELVRKLRALEYVAANPGQACPASRNIGAKTLQPSVKIAGNVHESLEG